jgi:hypothetical protein
MILRDHERNEYEEHTEMAARLKAFPALREGFFLRVWVYGR